MKSIALTQGKVAFVDDEDYQRVVNAYIATRQLAAQALRENVSDSRFTDPQTRKGDADELSVEGEYLGNWQTSSNALSFSRVVRS